MTDTLRINFMDGRKLELPKHDLLDAFPHKRLCEFVGRGNWKLFKQGEEEEWDGNIENTDTLFCLVEPPHKFVEGHGHTHSNLTVFKRTRCYIEVEYPSLAPGIIRSFRRKIHEDEFGNEFIERNPVLNETQLGFGYARVFAKDFVPEPTQQDYDDFFLNQTAS